MLTVNAVPLFLFLFQRKYILISSSECVEPEPTLPLSIYIRNLLSPSSPIFREPKVSVSEIIFTLRNYPKRHAELNFRHQPLKVFTCCAYEGSGSWSAPSSAKTGKKRESFQDIIVSPWN
jgi:hypothetical protein